MDKLKVERLKEWFQENPQEWQDVKAEIQDFFEVAQGATISPDTRNRDFYAGKCFAFREILRLEEYYLAMARNEKKE